MEEVCNIGYVGTVVGYMFFPVRDYDSLLKVIFLQWRKKGEDEPMVREKLELFLPFWNELEPKEQELLEQGCSVVKYEKGTLMHRCEQDCSGMMLVTKGQLRSYIVSEEGREVTLFRVRENDICVLSATCLMDAIVFDVLIDAVEDTEGIMLPSALLSTLLEKYPKIETCLYKTATERFSEVVWTMQQLLFLSMDRRIAIFLWDEMNRTKTLAIHLTHDEIARYIGSAREVVTKVLKYFSEEGIVSLGRGKIEILDKKMLKKYL